MLLTDMIAMFVLNKIEELSVFMYFEYQMETSAEEWILILFSQFAHKRLFEMCRPDYKSVFGVGWVCGGVFKRRGVWLCKCIANYFLLQIIFMHFSLYNVATYYNNELI